MGECSSKQGLEVQTGKDSDLGDEVVVQLHTEQQLDRRKL